MVLKYKNQVYDHPGEVATVISDYRCLDIVKPISTLDAQYIATRRNSWMAKSRAIKLKNIIGGVTRSPVTLDD
uniref:Myosin motor domain-containing protein n=1 Tax=Heterorhabditis bacteriophora TaxID=37862 RepID=A0A1I7WF89_HETBA